MKLTGGVLSPPVGSKAPRAVMICCSINLGDFAYDEESPSMALKMIERDNVSLNQVPQVMS